MTHWSPKFSIGAYAYLPESWRTEAELHQMKASMAKIRTLRHVKGIEFFYPQEFKHCKAPDLKELCGEMELSPANIFADFMGSGYGNKGSISSSDRTIRRNAIQTCKKAIDIAGDLGVPNVTIWIPNDGYDYPFELDYIDAWNRLKDALTELSNYAPEIKLAIEYRPFYPRSHSLVGTGAKTLALISELPEANLGVQLEISHTLMAQEGLGEIVALAGMRKKLFHLHINDSYPNMDSALIFGSISFWDCLEAIFWLGEVNYQGYLGLDVAPEWVPRSLENARFMARLLDSLDRRKFKELLSKGDAVGTQDLLWEAMTNVRRER